MTTELQEEPSKEILRPNFVTRFLPWIIAGGVLLIYLFTLNHWVTLKSLPVVAKIAGWDWHPTWFEPLHFLLTYPARWLPTHLQMPVLNFFAAICAALTLALLARSVALLPHDRTREQRQRETGKFSLLNVPQSWLPPLVAVLICGLQLTFWEHAVAATGEMLNLLIFAYVIRCLLEFRISQRECWLTKFALVYGVGVTNNWAMIGFFPIFLIALIWIKGIGFFNFRFILRVLGFGLLGLSLYLLFPVIAALSANSDQTFWPTLREHLRFQKSYLYTLPFVQVPPLRGRLLVIALTSLLPLLMIGIRWPSFRGDLSHAGGMVTAFMFRLMHLFFLAILLTIFFDLPFSPKELGYELMPLLTFYYLTALAVGYFVGYGLLVFGREPAQSWERPSSLFKLINIVILIAIWIAVIAVPLALARNNLPVIQATNSNALSQMAKLTTEALPPSGALVLSDDPARLHLLRAAYAQTKKPAQNILLETGSLSFPKYHEYLHQHHQPWPKPASTNAIGPVELIQQLETLNKTHPLFYLHPSFGYYFERFYPIPRKLVYELKPYPTNSITPPPLSNEVIVENQSFWNSFAKEIAPTLPELGKRSPEVGQVNAHYSRALNYWGTELQKAKLLNEANQAFALAISLNRENVAAQINQQFNANLRRGEIRAVTRDEEIEKKLGQYGSWQNALTYNGPFDERDACLRLGEIFARGGNLRQSALLFLRVIELSPKNFNARLGLAKTYIELQRPDDSLKLIGQLRDEEKTAALSPGDQLELLRIEAYAHLAKNDFKTAEKILRTAQRKNPKDENHLALLTQLYVDTGYHTNALESVQKQLQIAPQSPAALFTKAVLNMQLGNFGKAVESLDLLLKIQPNNARALMNRAIAHLQSGKLDAAERDYKSLRESQPKNAYQIYYGLAEVAEKKKNKSEAIKNFKLYLKYAPSGTEEFTRVKKRIADLQSGKS
ncbi:MAG: tetratricopeptide repeat protein [Verrucomicrobiota bacterium]